MKKISMDLIRCTEAAAIAASKYIGSGDKKGADLAATEAMRNRLNKMDFCAEVVIGEGIKDDSYGLFGGERVGHRCEEMSIGTYDLACDVLEGTTPTANGGPEAISTLSITSRGHMWYTNKFYMMKMAYGQRIRDKVQLSLDDPLDETIRLIRKATNKKNHQILVCVLDRPRHSVIISLLREWGVRIKLIQDCDVSAAVAACYHDEIDLLYGVGGAPEAVISACAIKCLKGDFQGQVYEEVNKNNLGTPYGKVLQLNDIVKGECAFACTGVTNGCLVKGVKWGLRPTTESLFMRSSSNTIRRVLTEHGN